MSGKDTENFTGADLTELCQRACRNAVRDSIDTDRKWIKAERERLGDPEAEVDKETMPDAVPCLTRDHFQEAFNNARRSVEPASLEYFNNYRRENDPNWAAKEAGGGVAEIHWPEDKNALPNADGEDDLYA